MTWRLLACSLVLVGMMVNPATRGAPAPSQAARPEHVSRKGSPIPASEGDRGAEGLVHAFETLRARDPGDPDLARALAAAYALDRRYGDAAAAYSEAAVLAPDDVEVALAQARFHLAGGFRVGEALRAAERARRIDRSDPRAIQMLDRARTVVALSGSG